MYSGQHTAVSLTPLLCPHNILTGLPHASVFLLSDMEWDGLRPRLGGYILYSSLTVLVLSLNNTVLEFTLDQAGCSPLIGPDPSRYCTLIG